eukprot:gnl/TRDRNA2_/TRDRNA2_38540_c0_seq1.p1 gnl/TRDRNA2_/TRDRNA2_38540_c0~~gnl/TRDRNA2_/TRDRNA2_38540_c0_seq1.p1  ORF type:complete len:196 (-),score=37.98 gnl/TRDRNA2_/TRDRNA2_38540_c0_seq1:129-716(-)
MSSPLAVSHVFRHARCSTTFMSKPNLALLVLMLCCILDWVIHPAAAVAQMEEASCLMQEPASELAPSLLQTSKMKAAIDDSSFAATTHTMLTATEQNRSTQSLLQGVQQHAVRRPEASLNPTNVEEAGIDKAGYAKDWVNEWHSSPDEDSSKMNESAKSNDRSGTRARRTGTVIAAAMSFALLQIGLRSAVLISL